MARREMAGARPERRPSHLAQSHQSLIEGNGPVAATIIAFGVAGSGVAGSSGRISASFDMPITITGHSEKAEKQSVSGEQINRSGSMARPDPAAVNRSPHSIASYAEVNRTLHSVADDPCTHERRRLRCYHAHVLGRQAALGQAVASGPLSFIQSSEKQKTYIRPDAARGLSNAEEREEKAYEKS